MDISPPDYLEVTFGRTVTVWWSLVWRTFVFSALLGAVLGFVGGIIVSVAGHPELGGAVGALLGWLGSIPVTIAVLRIVLRKQFGDFAIKLVKAG
jgi:hypothetical protein